MLISRGQEIAGYEAVTLRKWLRCLTAIPQTSGAFAVDIGITRAEADAILHRLAGESLVRQLAPSEAADGVYSHVDDPSDAPFWINTIEGNAIAKARIGKAMPRSKAEQRLAQFVERVIAYNDDEDRFYDIEWVEVFGSYQRGNDPVGDVDLRALAVRRFGREEHERRRADALSQSGATGGRGLVEQVFAGRCVAQPAKVGLSVELIVIFVHRSFALVRHRQRSRRALISVVIGWVGIHRRACQA